METPTAPSAAAADPAWSLLEDNGIDRSWLNETLNRAGFEGRLAAVDATLVGTGQVGENVRCRLRWGNDRAMAGDPTGGDRPDSVIIKLASSNAMSRAAAEATRTYIREVGFYRDLASSVAIRVPAVHHVSEDRAANRFVLVMEDISPSEAGDQLAGCSPERAELAVEAAADLHGSTWGREDLTDFDWIDDISEDKIAERAELFDLVYPGFVDRYRHRLDRETLAFGEWLAARFERWIVARPEPQCLVHGDFRLDNLLFGLGDPAPPLTTVDWQTVGLGGALSDVAYLLSGSLDRTTQRALESELLAAYRRRLAGHGVVMAAEQAWSEYRLAAPAGFVMAVIASQIVGQTDRGDEMFLVMAGGSAAMSIDLDTAALVD